MLNRPTLLFSVIRSAIAGEYVDTDGTRCIVTIIYSNDCLLLGRSARKRYSAEVRRAWDGFDCLCDRPDHLYDALFVNTYEVGGQRFEFVEGSDILRRLTHSPSTYSQIVGKGELFGVEVAALRDLSILNQACTQR